MREGLSEISLLKNSKSFKLFFENNYQVASLVALRYVDDVHVAEDIVQEVFLDLWQRRSALRLNSTLKSYLLGAVRNAALKYISREKNKWLNIEEVESGTTTEEDKSYNKEELAVKIFNAIENLSPKCQQVFKLAYLDKLTYNEIATELNVSVNTVKTQMKLAYHSLREQLVDYSIMLWNTIVKLF